MDCSFSLSLVLADERTSTINGRLELIAGADLYVPAIWPLEVANAFKTAYQRRRADERAINAALTVLEELQIVVDTVDMPARRWYEFAQAYRLTSYDAAYLELALRLAVPLATLDRELQRAARQLGLSLAIC